LQEFTLIFPCVKSCLEKQGDRRQHKRTEHIRSLVQVHQNWYRNIGAPSLVLAHQNWYRNIGTPPLVLVHQNWYRNIGTPPLVVVHQNWYRNISTSTSKLSQDHYHYYRYSITCIGTSQLAWYTNICTGTPAMVQAHQTY